MLFVYYFTQVFNKSDKLNDVFDIVQGMYWYYMIMQERKVSDVIIFLYERIYDEIDDLW